MDNSLARKLLDKALATAKGKDYAPKHKRASVVRNIIEGGHLTFRYILVTGVLGKATDPKIHPRSLQAGSTLKGAFDARSLCHGVLVPFERECLQDALGGSNEPYLNKPARFQDIDPNNAVRAGQDRISLLALHDLLEELSKDSSESAFNALCDCMYFALRRLKSRESLLPPPRKNLGGRHQILRFIEAYTSKSVEGETCATATGAILSCLAPIYREKLHIIVHPINQAGSSSNEVADIDVYANGKLYYAIEVKDKIFSVEDVQHAAKKVARAGHDSLVFVTGPQGALKGMPMKTMEQRLSSDEVSISFVEIGNFAETSLALTPRTKASEFYAALVTLCKSARVKDATIEHLNYCAGQLGWID